MCVDAAQAQIFLTVGFGQFCLRNYYRQDQAPAAGTTGDATAATSDSHQYRACRIDRAVLCLVVTMSAGVYAYFRDPVCYPSCA